jgi:2-dehydropantoate 2-reductase
MKIAIVGAGGMGAMTGGLLKEIVGEDVSLYDVHKEHIETIKRNGLLIEGIGGERHVPVNATTRIEDIGIPDLIIIFVKSYDTELAAAEAKKICGEHTTVLTLQNGLGNVEILERAFGNDKVLAGTTDAAATIVGPGRVKHTAYGNVYIGELNGEITGRVREIVTLFAKAGFNAHPSDNVLGLIWSKLILNLAINPLGTILRARCEKLIDNDYSRTLMREVVQEALCLAEKKGITLIYPDMVQAAYDLAEKNATSFNSMAQDFLKGKKTEIDFISGAIVKEGEHVGLPTPVNHTMTYIVKALEETIDK